MTRKKYLPQFPHSYLGEKAKEYDTQTWMLRNQVKATITCLEYLFDTKLGSEFLNTDSKFLILDLGCGTGFSSEVLVRNDFRVIGIDILWDMLSKANEKESLRQEEFAELILADMTHLPIRNNVIDHIISVSSYNFITHKAHSMRDIYKIINNTTKQLKKVLKRQGRVIIEFYPETDEELDLYIKSFISYGFDGYFVKKDPNQKGGQTFLLLKKEV
ncbi:MAG: class I SAM-dependent methyltransferase [Promethearchaeota archaeon]